LLLPVVRDRTNHASFQQKPWPCTDSIAASAFRYWHLEACVRIEVPGSLPAFLRAGPASGKTPPAAKLAALSVPLGKRVKDVLDCLSESRRPLTAAEVTRPPAPGLR
jgi:hypothetical protein